MIDHVFDFGALAPDTERIYIKAILRRQLSIYVAGGGGSDSKERKTNSANTDQNGDDYDDDAALRAAIAASIQAPVATFATDADAATSNELAIPATQARTSSSIRSRIASLFGRRSSRRGSRSTDNATPPTTPPAAAAGNTGFANVDPRLVSLLDNAGITATDFQQVQAQLATDTDGSKLAELQASLLTTKKGNKLSDFGEFVEVFADLICASQEFVRTLHGGERSVVSLRDVARCVKVYRWFGEHFASRAESWTLEDFFSVKGKARHHIRQAVILSLGYCYHARLPRDERRQFRKHLQVCMPVNRSLLGLGTRGIFISSFLPLFFIVCLFNVWVRHHKAVFQSSWFLLSFGLIYFLRVKLFLTTCALL